MNTTKKRSLKGLDREIWISLLGALCLIALLIPKIATILAKWSLGVKIPIWLSVALVLLPFVLVRPLVQMLESKYQASRMLRRKYIEHQRKKRDTLVKEIKNLEQSIREQIVESIRVYSLSPNKPLQLVLELALDAGRHKIECMINGISCSIRINGTQATIYVREVLTSNPVNLEPVLSDIPTGIVPNPYYIHPDAWENAKIWWIGKGHKRDRRIEITFPEGTHQLHKDCAYPFFIYVHKENIGKFQGRFINQKLIIPLGGSIRQQDIGNVHVRIKPEWKKQDEYILPEPEEELVSS